MLWKFVFFTTPKSSIHVTILFLIKIVKFEFWQNLTVLIPDILILTIKIFCTTLIS